MRPQRFQTSVHQPSWFRHPRSKEESLISGDMSHLLIHSALQGLSAAVGTCPQLCSQTAEGGGWRSVYPTYFLTSMRSSDSSPECQDQKHPFSITNARVGVHLMKMGYILFMMKLASLF